MKGLISALLLVLVTIPGNAKPVSVFPAYAQGYSQSLCGEWSFKYISGSDVGKDLEFHHPNFDVSGWKTIPVPSNWELEGFASPEYGLKLADGLGLYRRTFEVPANWSDGRRICLRFDGVAFGFRAWVNGREIGESSASAYNPHTFDITDALRSGTGNVVAVQVTTKPHGWKFDTNDDWSLSGIFRDVTVFSVPFVHLKDVVASTKLSPDGSAELSVQVSVSGPNAIVQGSLLSPDGKEVANFALTPAASGTIYSAEVRVEDPSLWTAETPSLYHLRLTLSDASGTTLQNVEKRIGLREVSIDGLRLLLNGRPIKMRGVTHHDLDPETGRALSEEQLRRDLELMQKGNINFIRTSHYPPVEKFIDLCDEMGFYVMLEVPLASRGGDYLEDPDFCENILTRAEATVLRDRSHPSIIVWSVGNENHVNEGEIAAIRRVKELDPTRPVTLPKTAGEFGSNYNRFPEIVDIFAAHYPSTGYLKAWTTRLKRPTIFTEYAHAQGLATERVESQWEILQATPQYAGGSIWHFHDQGILRASDREVDPEEVTVYAWPDKNHYYDTGDKLTSKEKGLDGADGIVYADRTPQTDFWEVRKVYSPVQIAEKSAGVTAGRQVLTATVENRHDFRSLKGIKLNWLLLRNGKAIQQGELPLNAASRGKETVEIPVIIPADAEGDVLALEMRCVDESGQQINERVMRLDYAGARRDAWLSNLPDRGMPRVVRSDKEVTVRHANFEIRVELASGELRILDHKGRVLVAGIHPHPGRKMLMVDRRGSKSRFGFWPNSRLTSVDDLEVKVSTQDSGVRLSVSGRYPRPSDSKQALAGGYDVTVTPGGVLEIHYRYEPLAAKGNFAEAGLSMAMPSEFSEFRWVGDGPYPGYPGKERLNEFGMFHLNKGDLSFQGNRRRTELAMLTTPEGAGVVLITSAADVAVERDEKRDQILLSHNAVISSLGNKLGGLETTVEAKKTPEVSGSFTLVPLSNEWPDPLTRRFGKPAAASEVFKPFYHSYDQ